jgi:hypothetical protein
MSTVRDRAQPRQRADLTELHFEVMVGKAQQKEDSRTLDLATLSVHGTAFAIAHAIFVTAGHVYADAIAEATQNDGRVVLVKQGQLQHANFVTDGEVFAPSDLAIMACNITHAAMPVSFDPLAIFDDVQANGFPFGQERMHDVIRGFKGHVVTRRRYLKGNSVGFRGSGQPVIYELSFVPPQGMSGAPLVSYVKHSGPMVHGIIVGWDTIRVNRLPTRIGIAVDSTELLRCDSRLLGGSVAEKVFGIASLPPHAEVPEPNF